VRWLLDEMLPPAAAEALRQRGHDARSAREAGLTGEPDGAVLDRAVAEARIVVTEDVADYSLLIEERLGRGEPCVPVVFVRRADLPARGALAAHLARRLDAWAAANPDPFLGAHWLKP
jgi:predicted nuclease of predicted toxin-antitoxin system